jgi:hypothetical protein
LFDSTELQRDAINTAQRQRAEVELGITVRGFTQSDHFADQRLADEDRLALPFNLAVVAHPARFEVGAVVRILQPGGIAARRGRPVACRWGLAQRLMRTLVVELVTEAASRTAWGEIDISAFGLGPPPQ